MELYTTIRFLKDLLLVRDICKSIGNRSFCSLVWQSFRHQLQRRSVEIQWKPSLVSDSMGDKESAWNLFSGLLTVINTWWFYIRFSIRLRFVAYPVYFARGCTIVNVFFHHKNEEKTLSVTSGFYIITETTNIQKIEQYEN